MVILQVIQLAMFESLDLASRPNWKLRIVLAAVVLVILAAAVWLFRMTGMPLKPYAGPLPPLNSQESELRDHLAVTVKYLAASIGERSLEQAGSLEKTAAFIRENLQSLGYAVSDVSYEVAGQTVSNIEAILVGTEATQDNIVVGAHYDSVAGTVGANDNAWVSPRYWNWHGFSRQPSRRGPCDLCSLSMKSRPTFKRKIWAA